MKYMAPLMVMPLVFLMVFSQTVDKQMKYTGHYSDSALIKCFAYSAISGAVLFVVFFLLERRKNKYSDDRDFG